MSTANGIEYKIEPNDTLFDLARRFLGDGNRWHEIEHDDGQLFTEDQARGLRPGMVVLIPGESDQGGGEVDGVAARVLEITNRERAQFGLQPLSIDGRLNASAMAHSRAMVDEGFFSHQGPGESELGDRIREQGYSWSACAENIAAGQSTAEDATSTWFNETPPNDGHRRNILNPELVHMGVGYIFAQGTRFGHYWTVDFGRPS